MNAIHPAGPIPQGNRLVALDGLRALAALQVLASHVAALLWQPSSEAPFWLRWHSIAAFPFRYGVQAVMAFFVLSGFVNHLKQANALASGKAEFNPASFLWSRARRLYPPLIAALLLTALIDKIGGSIAPEYYYPPSPRFSAYDPITAIGNLLFLQGIVVQTFGTNGALWALPYLGWFPLIYALVYMPIRRRVGPHWAFGFALALSGIGAAAFTIHSHFIGPLIPATPAWLSHVAACLGMWFLGAWLADHVVMGFRLRRPALWLMGIIVGIGGLAATHDPRVIDPLRDWLWAALSGGLILIAASPHESPLVEKTTRGLAFFAPLAPPSYTQYVIQLPLISFIRILFLHYHGRVPAEPWLALGAALGVILLARALAPVIEWPFTTARERRAPELDGGAGV